MMESIIFMTAGLLLDIMGSFLIVHVFFNHAVNTKWRLEPDGKWLITNGAKSDKEEFFRQAQAIIEAKLGFACLASGFFLIIIASWISYCETHPC